MRIERSTVGVTYGGQRAELPVLTLGRGSPTVVVTANVHGNELTGVAAAQRLLRILPGHLLRGTVHVYPSLNPWGLRMGSRYVASRGGDLNRAFPGDAYSQEGALAEAIWADLTARAPDLVIDLHSDSAHAVPYTIVDRPVALHGAPRRALEARLRELALATGLFVLHEYEDEPYQRFHLDRSLAGAVVNRLRVPALTLEVGPRGHVDPQAVGAMTSALLEVLRHEGLLAGERPVRSQAASWRRGGGPRNRHEGLFTPRVSVGEPFEAGAVLGWITSLDGVVLEELTSTGPGVVVSYVDDAWLAPGRVVATLGLPEEP